MYHKIIDDIRHTSAENKYRAKEGKSILGPTVNASITNFKTTAPIMDTVK